MKIRFVEMADAEKDVIGKLVITYDKFRHCRARGRVESL